MKKQCFLFSLLLATATANAASDDDMLQSTMGELATNLQDIFPMIFIPQKDLLQNQDKLKPKVKALLKSFDRAQPHIEQRTLAFKASYNVMRQHLKDTDQLLNHDEVIKASQRLKVLPSLCVSCHTQDAKQKRYFMGLERENFGSDYQYAEFSFATRDYASAITYFDKFLTNKGIYKSEDQTETALERLLTLYVQVDHEPTMAATYLQEYVPFIVDYPEIKVTLESWVKDLNNMPQHHQDLLSGKKTLTFSNLRKVASPLEMSASSNNTVNYVVVRGLIHTYLNQEPEKSEIPQLLYWLALADKKLNYQYYHSYADIYLKECFTNYPDHPYAKRCKKEYESFNGVA